MKPIKFDLPLNGTKVHNLEELRDNFTTEILELHASGVLLKWLKSRNLTTEAGRLSAITSHQNDAATLAALCKIFGIDADRAERELLREQMGEACDLLQESLQELALLRISLGTTTNNDPATEPTPDRSASGRRVIPAHFANASLDADQSVIEVATSKGQTDQVVTFHEYPDEMQGKKSELSDYLGDGKLYLSQDDYKLFVKTKIRIEQKGRVVKKQCQCANWILAR